MEAYNLFLRVVTIIILACWEGYWILTAKIAEKEKPKTIPTSYASLLRKILSTEAIGFIVFLQLLGLPFFPFSQFYMWISVLGFLFVIIGVSISVAARRTLTTNWTHAAEYQIKKNHELITRGIYQYIRHPIYSGVIFAAVGAELVVQSYLCIVFFLGLGVICYLQGRKEEHLLLHHFGKPYQEYLKKTKMFLPYIV